MFNVLGSVQPNAEAASDAACAEDIIDLRTVLASRSYTYKEVLSQGFEIVRYLGIKALTESEQTGSVGDLLSRSKALESPPNFIVKDDLGGSIAGDYDARGRILRLRSDQFQSHSVNQKLASFAHWRDEKDAHLISFINLLGHEAGHALLGDISHYQSPPRSYRLYATRNYLTAHPEMGLTSNWYTDSHVHEERFAEGYGRVAVKELLKVMGYGPYRRHQILARTSLEIRTDGEKGENQIDHLDAVDDNTPIHTLVEGNSDYQSYAGALGFRIPLSLRQMRNQLSELAIVGPSEAEEDDLTERPLWEEAVRAHRSIGLKLYIAQLKLARSLELHPQIKQAVMRAKLGGLCLAESVKQKIKRWQDKSDLFDSYFGAAD